MSKPSGSAVKKGDEPLLTDRLPIAFVKDVDAFMALPENSDVEKVLRRFDELYHKNRVMEMGYATRIKKLREKIPDLELCLQLLKLIKEHKEEDKELQTEYLLSDLVYMRAIVPPTDKVCLWLGANVMLEYTLAEAAEVVQKNLDLANDEIKKLETVMNDLKDYLTTLEVNTARVFNWDVKRRQEAKAANKSASASTSTK